MTDQFCPSCTQKIVQPSGPRNSFILLLGEFPGKTEIDKGIPFATHPMYITAGKVLRTELANAGIDFNTCRVTNLWLHEQNDNENCFDAGKQVALEEAKSRKAVLLIGSLVVETFTNYKVSEVSGLQVDSPLLSAPIVYAMMNPALVFQPGRGIGEIRQAVQKFARRLEKEGLV